LRIIYYCFAGAHASVVASAIHCRLLPSDRVPTYDELVALPHYDKTQPALIGRLYDIGLDEYGNSVYCMGMWNQRDNLKQVLASILQLAEVQPQEYLFQDAFPLITFSTKLGGALSKRMKFITLGRRMSVWGIQRRYFDFVQLVAQVKAGLS
jgi:hypothetical protein